MTSILVQLPEAHFINYHTKDLRNVDCAVIIFLAMWYNHMIEMLNGASYET